MNESSAKAAYGVWLHETGAPQIAWEHLPERTRAAWIQVEDFLDNQSETDRTCPDCQKQELVCPRCDSVECPDHPLEFLTCARCSAELLECVKPTLK